MFLPKFLLSHNKLWFIEDEKFKAKDKVFSTASTKFIIYRQKKVNLIISHQFCRYSDWLISIGNVWFVVIFGINTSSDISNLLYVISRAVGRVRFKTSLKYHEWYLSQISHANHAIICLYYYPQKVCNFHMKVFQIKLKYRCSKPIKL